MINYAKQELELLNKDNDEIQNEINKNILEIVEVFSKQGHSGFTAEYIISMLEKLLRHKNLMPLTGEDNEWTEIAEGIFQNKRDSTIFKDNKRFNGKPYTINGKIFTDDGGNTWFTSRDSVVIVEFPLNGVIPEKVYLKEKQ